MAALTTPNQAQEDALWASTAVIVSFFCPPVTKSLGTAIDSLVDPTVATPENAYTIG